MAEEKLWGGRFSGATGESVEEYSASVDFDRLLYAQDIQGSKAHVSMLVTQGVLSGDEGRTLLEGLDQVLEEIESGGFTWRRGLEDVHMNIESRLIEIVGPVGKKLHTGRSRNDQVALDFRLYVSDRLSVWHDSLLVLIRSLADQAARHTRVILPGCTHLQPAQPVSLAHHLLAYVEMFKRDAQRIQDCQKRVRVSPLGAAALAGTTYPVDPWAVAEYVGFGATFQNSMDAVSDRDFVLEPLFVAATVMTHLSRLCEEIVLWSNPGFGYVLLPDAFATGSSIMPQKKNPDVAEIMRGKTGRVYGDLMAVLTILKGLPLAYNRDLQEDKEPFMDADRTVSSSVRIMGEMMAALSFDQQRMAASLRAGYCNATELADYLTEKGVPFREAHHITGRAVAHAESRGLGLEDIPLQELRTFSPLIGEDVFSVLDYEACVSRRKAHGGTGFEQVQRQLQELRGWLQEQEGKAEQKSGGSV